MCLIIEVVVLDVGDIRVNNCNSDQLFTTLEHLHIEFRRACAKLRFDEFTGLDLSLAEVQLCFDDGVAVRQDIGNDLHLGDTLDLNLAAVFTPFAVCQKAVDGLGHVT